MLPRYTSSVRLLILLLSINFAFGREIFIKNVDNSTDGKSQRPEVMIPQGKIQGVNLMTRSERKFFGFQGIPFAQPPIGDLRFKGPLPAAAWSGTRDGGIISDQCPQMDGTEVSGNEDCLYLNVFTPRLPVTENSTLLPVMVFVFGGGFNSGTNSPLRYGPQFILDKDVVLVTPNYRMGILGYLSTGDEILPGNYGLKDLVIALKWIQNNIRHFGGDPNEVTLMGQSAGAMSVHLLTMTDSTEGLFQRYITDSGSALAMVACQPKEAYVKRASKLGEYLGCPTDTSADLVHCLRGFNASQLVDTNSVFYEWYVFPIVIWGPTVEPDIKGALITDSPANLIAAKKARDLPWMASVTRDEGIYFRAIFWNKPDIFQEFLDNLDYLMPIVLQYRDRVDNVTIYTDTLKSHYLNDLTVDTDLLLANFSQLAGDSFFVYSTYNGIRQLIHATQPRYFASFEFRGTTSYSYIYTNGSTTNWGVAHGDELLYLFTSQKSLLGPPGWEFNNNDWRMVDTMVHLWTSFVINGVPTTSELNCTLVWEPFSSKSNYLQIGNGSDIALKIGHNLNADRMRIWEELDSISSKSADH